ncbi:MAG: PKD domain-containing protein [Thermoplasmatales archaeon]|nr:MAG: PKD domain-containing protein [Thermoplasmatales archaeon]
MHFVTRKKIIAIELIILLIISVVTGNILLSNIQLGNNQGEKRQEIDVQILCDRTNGKAPLEIEFSVNTNLKNKETLNYQWDFGDGTTSSEINPNHIFQKPGTYLTKLTITDANGNYGTDAITINVEETPPPKARIDVSTITGISPLLIYFYGNKDSEDGNISYSWEFGPKWRIIVPESKYRHSRFFRYLLYHYRNREYFSNERNPAMVFIQSGTYWAELTITGVQGHKDTDKVWIHVYTSGSNDD